MEKILIFSTFFIIFFLGAYQIGFWLDRRITARARKISPEKIGKKETRMFVRYVVLGLAWLAIPGFYLYYFTGDTSSLNFLAPMAIYFFSTICSLGVFLSKNWQYKKAGLFYPLYDKKHIGWAEDNGFVKGALGHARQWNGVEFLLSYDYLSRDRVARRGEGAGMPSGGAFLLVKMKNAEGKIFELSSNNAHELWSEIGPEHLQFIKDNSIEFFATGQWFVARMHFDILEKMDPEKLFGIMTDILKETKYRAGAGFGYRDF